jgi:hypothetical protein
MKHFIMMDIFTGETKVIEAKVNTPAEVLHNAAKAAGLDFPKLVAVI